MLKLFNVYGIGQCGCRITSEFDTIGFNSYYINSDSVDMRDIRAPKSKVLQLDTSGSGGSPAKGKKILENNFNKFSTFMDSTLEPGKMSLFVLGLGGGTGGGMIIPTVEYALQKGHKVGVIATLPPKMLGMLAMDNAMKVLRELRRCSTNFFMLADNELLISKVGISANWWQKINYYIISKLASAFDLIRDEKISQTGIGSIDKAEVLRIMQYGNGLLDIRDIYFNTSEIQLPDDEIKKRLFEPALVEGYNYKDTLAYLISVDIPQAQGGFTEFSNKIFNMTKKVCGSSISRLGMFTDPLLDRNIRVTIINSGLKLPKVLQSKINNLRRDSERHDEKKNKADALDFSDVDSINLESNFEM